MLFYKCKPQNNSKLKVDLVCLMEEVDGINPVLADIVMEAGYSAIDDLFTPVFSLVE